MATVWAALPELRYRICKETCGQRPFIPVSLAGNKFTALVGTGAQVTSFKKSFYDQSMKSILTRRLPPEKQNIHHRFRLTVANDTEWQLHHYGEIDFDFLGLRIDELSFLVTDDSGELHGEPHR